MQKQSAFMNVVVRKFAAARRRLNPRPPEPLPPLSKRGIASRALPASLKSVGRGILTATRRAEDSPACHIWPQEDCANEPSPLHCFGEDRALWALGARLALLLVLLAMPLSAAVHEVGVIGLTVGDLNRELEFYTKILPFEKVYESKSNPGVADELLGLRGTQLRSAELKLGDERIRLTEHLINKGRPIPT